MILLFWYQNFFQVNFNYYIISRFNILDSCFEMKLEFWLYNAFSPHLNIHIMAKMVISHLFMDILAAILKGALYLESPEF